MRKLSLPSVLTALFFLSVLSVSLGFALTSFDGKSGERADTNRFIDAIGERLQQAIGVYQRKPLGEIVELPSCAILGKSLQ